MLLIIEDGILPRGNALYLLLAIDTIATRGIIVEGASGELRGMTDLEGDGDRLSIGLRHGGIYPRTHEPSIAPGIETDEVRPLHLYMLSILISWVVALRDEDDVATDVLLDDKPRAST